MFNRHSNPCHDTSKQEVTIARLERETQFRRDGGTLLGFVPNGSCCGTCPRKKTPTNSVKVLSLLGFSQCLLTTESLGEQTREKGRVFRLVLPDVVRVRLAEKTFIPVKTWLSHFPSITSISSALQRNRLCQHGGEMFSSMPPVCSDLVFSIPSKQLRPSTTQTNVGVSARSFSFQMPNTLESNNHRSDINRNKKATLVSSSHEQPRS